MRFLVTLFSSAFFSAHAATWYVDSSVGASGNGTSWATAWKALSNITGVSAGDTVYISGGASGSSQTYSVSSWKPTGGGAGNPITYQIGQDAAHNGTAIFSGSGTWFGGANNVIISGNAGDGAMHFSLASGYSAGVNNNGTTGLRISYVNLGNTLGDGVDGQGVTAFEFDHNYCYILGTQDHFLSCGFVDLAFDGTKIHDNTIFVPKQASSANGCDAFQISGSGWSLYNNTIQGYNMAWSTSAGVVQHQDGIQTLVASYVKIYGNDFADLANTSVFMDGYYGAFNHIYIYNNVCQQTTSADNNGPGGIEVGADGAPAVAPSFNDVIVANNVMVDQNPYNGTCIAFGNCPSCNGGNTTPYTACYLVNNIDINSGTMTTYSSPISTADNVTLTTAQGQAYFTSYHTLSAANDYHLTAAATALIGKGTNESAYFTTDRDGNARAATGNWDVGAYVYAAVTNTIPVIQVTPGSIAYGAILNGTSKTNSFTVQNVGVGTLTGTASVGAPFSIVSGGSYSLGASGSQTVTVVFSPTAATNYNQGVTFTGGNGTNTTVTGSATNAPVPAPVLQVTPGSIAYGTILNGTSKTNSFTVQNIGTGTLTGTASVGAPFSIVSGGSYSLGASGSQTVTVVFSPTAATNYNQGVTFTGGNGTNTTVTGSATNAPVPAPVLQVTPGSIAYGTILNGTSKTNSFTVQNIGTGTLTGTASVGAPFSIVSGGSYSLGASGSQTVTVVFSPTAATNYNQGVTFTGGNGTNTTVTGSATNAPVPAPVLQVTPGSIAYGTILNGTSKTNSFTVQNIGTGTLTGTASVGAPFSIVSGGSYSLGASGSQTVTVVFSPTAATNYNQGVTFTGGNGTNTTVTGSATNAPVPAPVLQVTPGSIAYGTILNGTSKTNSFTVQNIGTGTLTGTASVGAPFSIVSGGSYSLGASGSQTVTVVFSPTAATNYNQGVTFTGGNGTNTTVTGSATNAPVPAPVLQVTPGSIAYGTILNGTSKTNSFTVQNIGTGTLTGTASVGAPFSIVSGGSYSLGASGSQTVTVVFSPTAATNYNQGVTFTGGNGTNTTVTGSATNAPVPAPVLQVTPGSIAYGTILNGTSKTNSFTVQNIGTGTLTGTASVGAPFSIVSGGSYSLGASGSQTVTVVFSPTAATNYNQGVTFTGGNGTNTTVTGSATNTPPVLPAVSAINVNATDVDLSLPGLQIYAGTTVQFSANATNAQTWQWSYAVNGGAPVVWTNNTSPITNISCYFDTNTIGNSYVWTLVVSNSQGWAESQTNLEVEVQLPGTTNTGLIFTPASGNLTNIFTATATINGVPTSYMYLPLQAIGDVSGGTAVFNFTLANAGNYEIQALVDAPSTDANSFYVNIDASPYDSTMIWDIMPTTLGFEQRIVSWRGNGSENNDQIVPKVFGLSAGPHQIIFMGREPGTGLASFTLLQVIPAPPSSPASVSRSIQSSPAQLPVTPDGLRIVSP